MSPSDRSPASGRTSAATSASRSGSTWRAGCRWWAPRWWVMPCSRHPPSSSRPCPPRGRSPTGRSSPFSFETPKSPEEITSEGESRAFNVRPVYRYSPTAYDSALAKARSFFAELERAEQQGPDLLRAVAATRVSLGAAETEFLTVEEQRRRAQAVVTHFLAEMLSRGVADAGVLRGEPSRQVSLRRAEAERVVPRDSILTFADLMERAEAAASAIESPAGQRAVRRLVGAFYHPTVVPDLALTSSRREQLRASVDPVQVLRERRRADRDGGAAGHRGRPREAGRAPGRDREAGKRASLLRGARRRTAVQRDRDGRVLAAAAVLPAGDLRPSSGR